VGDPLEDARKALDRHAWGEALALLRQADASNSLDGEGLEMLADAAWWTAQPDEAFAARERAHGAFAKAGDTRRAAQIALRIAQDNAVNRSYTTALAWFERASKLLEGDEDCAAFGYLLFSRGAIGAGSMSLDELLELGGRAAELGRKFGDRDLEAFGTMGQGLALVGYGDPAAGLARLDQATVAAVAGELSPWSTGWVYCGTIGACREIADYRRASEWTEAATRWCERQSVTGFPGICRVYRAEVVAQGGQWAQAEQEARKACEELQRFHVSGIAAQGYYAIGDIRLRMGDLPAAEDAFRLAHELGAIPEPGLAPSSWARRKASSAAGRSPIRRRMSPIA